MASPSEEPGVVRASFDPAVSTARDLQKQPISVIKTELPALAEALGVTPAELFRSLTGESITPESQRSLREVRDRMQAQAIAMMESSEPTCCYSDSW
jgi:hypothetical protein